MKNRKEDLSENRILLTGNMLRTIVLALFLLTLITTALSMAKYAVTKSSDQLASVNSSEFIFSSDLVTSGTNAKETITGDLLTKTSYTLSDAYVPFYVKNYESANGVTHVNGENIDYRIQVTGDIQVFCVTDMENPQDANGISCVMDGDVQCLETFKIQPNGTDPGIYEGTVTVESSSPYIKKYVRDIIIDMKDVEVTYREDTAQLYVEIQNGIKENVVVEFQYLSPIYEINVNVPESAEIEKNEYTTPKTTVITLPAGVKVSIQFRSSGVVLRATDVPYTIRSIP